MIKLESAIHSSRKALSRTVEHNKNCIDYGRLYRALGTDMLYKKTVRFSKSFPLFAKFPFSHRSVRIRRLNISRHYFVFSCFLSLSTILRAG